MKTGKNNIFTLLISLLLSLSLMLSGCSLLPTVPNGDQNGSSENGGSQGGENTDSPSGGDSAGGSDGDQGAPPITLDTIPEFDGETPFVVINGNVPFFNGSENTTDSYESFTELDSLGRCGAATACITKELMPTEDREPIGNVYPSGWQSVKYDIVSGKYLYNRSHLIGFQLTGENDNSKNLITGTRFMNVEGMLPFEDMVADYIKDTNGKVLYRVTPIFKGTELVARGVLMEALSIGASPEENGDADGIQFCVYVYNNQPGIAIDYATGASHLSSETPPPNDDTQTPSGEATYILNTNTMKFHKPDCSHAASIQPDNREESTKTRDELLEEEYTPCGVCKP